MENSNNVVRSHVRWYAITSPRVQTQFNIARRVEDSDMLEENNEESGNEEPNDNSNQVNVVQPEINNQRSSDNNGSVFRYVYYLINEAQGTFRRISLDEMTSLRNRNNRND